MIETFMQHKIDEVPLMCFLSNKAQSKTKHISQVSKYLSVRDGGYASLNGHVLSCLQKFAALCLLYSMNVTRKNVRMRF